MNCLIGAVLLLLCTQSVAHQVPDYILYSRWIQDMKTESRGPFERIMWFCNDGTVLPPEPYACRPHGGGIQHGQWNERIRTLRKAGHYIGNVLAEFKASDITQDAMGRQRLHHILLERYLIAVDKGWLFRRASHYRGAFQIENEIAGARRILMTLNSPPFTTQRDYLLRRDAIRLLPHGLDLPSLTEVRQRSTDLARIDPDFESLRNKIHGQLDAMDAQRVRTYALKRPVDAYTLDYEHLAMAIDQLYRPANVSDQLSSLAQRAVSRRLASDLRMGAEIFDTHLDPETRFEVSSELLTRIRNSISEAGSAEQQLDLLDASSALELEAFRVGTRLVTRLPLADRTKRMAWLEMASAALYGTGMISLRQWRAIETSIRSLQKQRISLTQYRDQLRYLSRVPSWVTRWQQFHYGAAIERLSAIEPLVHNFIAEQLRSGLLIIYTNILDSLVRDANRLAQMTQRLFDEPVGAGLRMLNPGLARGVLREPRPGQSGLGLAPDGIYLLPATMAELSPVAGIITLGEGNALSHIQILASNLGIPNVVVDQSLVARLQQRLNQPVVLAVTPGGRVVIEEDGPQWDDIFDAQMTGTRERIEPNLEKLDLNFKTILRLKQLRASDSGRLTGPKAANLGELKRAFPDLVPSGVVIPFGVFRQLLDQEMVPGGKSAVEWMREQYRLIDQLADQPQAQHKMRYAISTRLRKWILQTDPGESFRQELRQVLEVAFGSDDSYTLFVRSDTNMEDLPGFSGAGLNLTVPNVAGFENLLQAISSVWTSPFGKRAFAWRQQRMSQPEHVYTSILLMPSIAVEKSGVMVTMDVETGRRDHYSIAVNEGIGGVVAGQAAEELRLNAETGKVQLLAEATAPFRQVLSANGGLQRLPTSSRERVLEQNEIDQLLALAKALPRHFSLRNERGDPAPADVEFGFYRGRLVLFQIRPYTGRREARENRFLNRMDAGLHQTSGQMVPMHEVPGVGKR